MRRLLFAEVVALAVSIGCTAGSDVSEAAIQTAIAQTEAAAPTETQEPTEPPTEVPTEPPQLTATAANEVGQSATVTRVIDGDTIEVELDGQTHQVRYIGINTPEADQTCGSEATMANAELVQGQTVTLVKDVSEIDQYGRLLRYVYVGDVFVNAQLVTEGYAQAEQYPPDVAHYDDFVNLELLAVENSLGCHPTGIFEAINASGVRPPDSQPTPASQPTSAPPPTNLPPPTQAPAVCDCSGNIYNCANFGSHASAQACFGYCYNVAGYDVHRLDGDNDGVACEALP